MKPTIGRIVHYKLTEEDKKNLTSINNATGRYGNHGNQHNDIVPAIIVAIWGDYCVNLQVFVDGHMNTLWKCSINMNAGQELDPGKWMWPPRE